MEPIELIIPSPAELSAELRKQTPTQAKQLLNSEILNRIKDKVVLNDNCYHILEPIRICMYDIFRGYIYDDIVNICKSLLNLYRAKGYSINSMVRSGLDYPNPGEKGYIFLTITKFEWLITGNGEAAPPSYDEVHAKSEKKLLQTTTI
jgi:hypothetical protein